LGSTRPGAQRQRQKTVGEIAEAISEMNEIATSISSAVEEQFAAIKQVSKNIVDRSHVRRCSGRLGFNLNKRFVRQPSHARVPRA
jgi:hypothetical protein